MVLEVAWAILGYIFYPFIWIVTAGASVVVFLFKLGVLLVICVAPAVYCFPGFRQLVIDFWVAVAGSSFLAYRQFCRREEREAADFRQRVREYRIRRRHSDTASQKSGGSLASGRSALSLSDRVPQQILPPALRGYSGWLLKLGKSYRATPLVPWLSESTAWTLRFANFVINDYLSQGIKKSASSGLALLDEADGDTEGEQRNGLEVVSEEEEGGIEEDLEDEEEEELRRGLQGNVASAAAKRPFLEGQEGGDEDIRLRIAAAGSSDPSPRQVIRAEQRALQAGGESRSRDCPSAGTLPGGRSSTGLPLSEHSSHRSRRSGAAKHKSIGNTDSRRRLSSGQSLQSLPAGRGPLSPQPGGLPTSQQQHLHLLHAGSPGSPRGAGALLTGSPRGSPRLIPTDSAPGDHQRGSGRDSLASIDLGLLEQARRDTAESIESGIGSGNSNGGALTPLSPLGGGGPIEAGISSHRRQVSAGFSSLSSFPATPRVEQEQSTRDHHSTHPKQRRQSSTGAYIAQDHPDLRTAKRLGTRKASGGIASGHGHGHEHGHSPSKRGERHRPTPSISNGRSSVSEGLDRAPDSSTPLAHSREASHAAHSDDSSGDEDHSKHAGFWQQEQEQSSRARTSIGSTGSKEFVKKLHSSIHGGSSKARSRSHHRGH